MSKKYMCEICGYEYDPAEGEAEMYADPGTPFEEIDELDCLCPVCSADKHMFIEVDDE